MIPADNYSQVFWFEKGFIDGCKVSAQQPTPPHFLWFPVFSFLYSILKLNSVCWMSLSMLVHAFNAFLIFLFAKKIFTAFFSENNFWVAFCSSFIFLVSPYQTEDILWTPVSIRWLLNVTMIFSAIIIFLSYLKQPSLSKKISICLLFLFGIFLNEPALVLPGIFVCLFFLFYLFNKTNVSIKSFFAEIIFPQAIFIFFYFFCSKLWSGHWIWHDGSFTEMSQTYSFHKTLLKYFVKFFLFYRYFTNNSFDLFLRNTFSGNFYTTILFFVFAVVLLFFCIKTIRRKREKEFLLLAIFICFLLQLLPVLSIDSSFVKYIYPDRYGYPPSAFFYLFLFTAVFFFLKKIFIPVSVLYSGLCIFLLSQTIPVWISANTYCKNLVQKFEPYIKYDHVYVLGLPSYYNGIAAFRSAFVENIFYAFNKSNGVDVIAGYYFESPNDSIRSAVRKENTFSLTGRKKSTPFFSIGAGWPKPEENDEYKTTFDSSGCVYILEFKKNIPENSVFVYAAGNEWRKVN